MSEQFDLLDVLAGTDDRRDAERARQAAYTDRRASNPDGRTLAAGETWCGRCGATVRHFDLVINHDSGWLGCPVGLDPTWKHFPRRQDGRGFRGYGVEGHENSEGSSGQLTTAEMCDRWDRQFFIDCECGCPWGLHKNHGFCTAWCGCDEYREASA